MTKQVEEMVLGDMSEHRLVKKPTTTLEVLTSDLERAVNNGLAVLKNHYSNGFDSKYRRFY